MSGLGFKIAILFLKLILFIYDVLTLPLYAMAQQPWVKRRDNKEPKRACGHHDDVIVVSDKFSQAVNYDKGITYRSLIPISAMHIELERGKIDTMDKVFSYAVRRNGNKKCLGYREVFDEEDEVQPNGRVFKKLILGEYLWKTYDQVGNLALYFSKGLLELGLEPKGRLAIFAETRAEWLIGAMAAFKQNLTIVTLYATLGDDAVVHGLNETEVTHVLTSHELMGKFRNILKKVPTVTNLIFIEDHLRTTDRKGFQENLKISSFCEVIDLGNKSSKGTTAPSPSDVAVIMYTSGSTGVPKGVLLSHNNIATTMMAFADALSPFYSDDIYIGFLPLAHVLELILEGFCFLAGIRIGYSTPLTLTDNSSKIKRGCKGDITVLQPTVMASVPLILDRISKEIQDKIAKGGKSSQSIFKLFYDYKLKWYKRSYNTPLLNHLLFGKVREALGGNLRLMICGGAPLASDTQEFIRTCLCIPLLQGYGLTETVACASVSLPADRSLGRVGGPVGCCDIKLEDWEEGNYRVTDMPYPRGEVLIGGDNVCMGYFKLPEATKAEFSVADGRRWFRTGDIAEMHPDGVLKIIDRKKDLVKLQFGEYVSLGKVESELKTCSLVDNICIYGDSTKMFVVALVIPAPKHLENFAKKLGRNASTLEEMCCDVELESAVCKELQETGRKSRLEKFELPGSVKLISELWTPDLDLVTAAFKLKRKNIQIRYQNDIDRMYSTAP